MSTSPSDPFTTSAPSAASTPAGAASAGEGRVGGRLEHLAGESGLTHPQIQIWIGQKLDPASPLYNMAFAFVLDGAIDRVAFDRAWSAVVDESDALRTYVEEADFGKADRAPRRRVRAVTGGATTEAVDLSVATDPMAAFRAWCHDRAARALALDGELFDSALVKLGRDRYGWYLNQHHLITDAASTVQLFRRVAEAYGREVGDAAALETDGPAVSYYAAAEAQRAVIDDSTRAAAVAHWRSVGGQGERAAAFYGRSRSALGSRSRRVELEIDELRTRRLNDRAAEPGFLTFTAETSTYAVLATLLTAWLHRLTGAEALSFDAPALNRATAEAKRALGLFVEMFPLVVEVEPGDTFRSLGERCLAETRQFLRYAVPGTSAPSGATVSNVVLNFFPGRFGDFGPIPSRVEWVHSGHGDRVHALRLQVHDFDGRGRYTFQFDANEEVFPGDLADLAAAHFAKLLDAFLDDPDRPIAAVDVLSEAERATLVEDYNAGPPAAEAAPWPERSLVALFRSQAARTPDAIALCQGERELTFAELAARVDRLAARLVRRGVGPGDRVALFMRRSIEAVVGILAVLRARAAYVPIDPAYPASRVDHILSDSAASLVLTCGGVEPEAASDPTATPVECLRVDRPEPSSAAESELEGSSPEEPSLDDLAYVIYTSGSTGEPKGVSIEHRGLVDYLEWAARQYVRGERLTFPLFTSLSFDLTVTSLYLPLITGGTLRIYEESSGPVDSAVIDVVGENRVDIIKLTPSHLALLRQLDLTTSRIRRMVVGGESFRADLAAAIARQFDDPGAERNRRRDGIEIYNEYGPTEAVVGCMIHRFDPSADTGASVPIGRPADHVEIYVLNEELEPVPAGVPGELCVSRHGLARGYHGRPELTERQFVDHPFAAAGGRRLYRTGDLARFASPGVIEYLGRIDRQVKISGFRIEPGEIETALASHPAVDACVVHPQRRRGAASLPDATVYCTRCGIPSNFPRIVFDDDEVCSICRTYEAIEERANDYFRSFDELEAIFRAAAERNRSDYDCLSLLSGGKDSTYVLCRLVDLGYKPLAFTLDNGFISEQAKDNVRRVCADLGVDHELATTPAMNAIFKDSLVRFSNVCQGCFKTIYTLSVQRAKELGIPLIVTGLSRGQFFETRLTEDLFRDGFTPQAVDAAVLEARKAYHRVDDAVSRLLDVELFRDDAIFDEVEFVDFYRYSDTSLSELVDYLARRVQWVRPSDTGRSTNCLINDVGIYIHKKERGFHNYALPYSWDVRLGHKQRDEALEELDDEIDLARVRGILEEIDYDENRLGTDSGGPSLVAYYVAAESIPSSQLRRHLATRLPLHLVPQHFVRLGEIPLSPNGKVDVEALPTPAGGVERVAEYVAPEGPAEAGIAAIWAEVLGSDRVGAQDSFFELGGTSLAAMEVMLRVCCRFDADLPLQTLFQRPTVRQLGESLERHLLEEIEALSEEEAERLLAEDDRSE